LIRAGADLNKVSTNDHANRPLHAAIAGGQLPVVELLLAEGADPNAAEGTGLSPLHLAVLDDRASLLPVLVRAGADPSLPTTDGRLAVELAPEGSEGRAYLQSVTR